MGILNFLRKKPSKENPADTDDEYLLPPLEKGGFEMNEGLSRRKEDEELLKKYGIVPEKTGQLI